MAKVKNHGDEVAYLPTDGGTVALEPGETSGELRLGDADYAHRNVKGVQLVDDELTVQGITKASIGEAAVPISQHEAAHPEDVRYAVAGDFVGSGVTPEVIPGTTVAPGTVDGATPEQLVGPAADEEAAKVAAVEAQRVADQAAADAAVKAEADAAAAKRASTRTSK